MKKKVLIFACSNQTIFNAVAIKEKYFLLDDVDLVILVQVNEAGFDYRLYEIILKANIFNKIYLIEKASIDKYILQVCDNKIKKLFYGFYLKKYFKIFLKEINSEGNYSEILCPLFYHYISHIINSINLRNETKIKFYEEGTVTYDVNIKELALYEIYLIKYTMTNANLVKKIKTNIKTFINEKLQVMKLMKYIDSEVYVYWPEHIRLQEIKPKKIPSICDSFYLKKIYDEYSMIIDDIKINRYRRTKVIFMSDYLIGSEELQHNIINSILNIFSRNNVILKMHPGSTKNRKEFAAEYENEVYIDREAYYFDALNMVVDFNNKILIGTNTSTFMNCKNIFDKEPYLIFLSKLNTIYYTNSIFRRVTDEYIEDLKHTYKDKDKIFVPSNIYEFNCYLNLIKEKLLF